MAQIEIQYARQFYLSLKDVIWGEQKGLWEILLPDSRGKGSDIKIDWSEQGVHSTCVISRGDRSCHIGFCHIDRKDVKYKGPEYMIGFKLEGRILADGRIFDRELALESVKSWVFGLSLEDLYAEYAFVDRERRQLEKIRSSINATHPDLVSIAQNEVVSDGLSSFCLWFKDGERGCKVSFWGYEEEPKCSFYWDGSKLFEFSTLNFIWLGGFVHRWVFVKDMPSSIQQDYPTLDMGNLIDYFEQGRGIEGEFMLSWDAVEQFYKQCDFKYSREMLAIIQSLREMGFDKTLRAGQSLFSLLFSRSRRYGLREEQPRVGFIFSFNGDGCEIWSDNGFVMAMEKVELNEKIVKVLRDLELKEID